MNFIKQHGAELVTNLAQEQRDALNAVIAHCSGYTAVTPDEAARMIRPCIGLTKPQALANMRYRDAVKTAFLQAHPKSRPGTAEKKAAEATARYAARQHRYRAQNIARTELAFAYNAGHYGATKDAQAQGYIGDCVKVWLTAYDERVCPICSKMDEEKRNMDVPFSNGKLFPPGHPQCRCAVAYEEIPGTNLNPVPSVPPKVSPTAESGAHVELPMSQLLNEDGTLDLEKAKEFYRNLLQSVPEKNKIYLQQALEAVEYQQRKLKGSAFGYQPANDVIAYDPTSPLFPHYDFPVVFTHELAHRIDRFFVRSWEQNNFKTAIQREQATIKENPDFFVQFCKQKDTDGFLSDIMSAICKDKIRFPFWHEENYWGKAGNQERDTFANLFSLETFRDEEKLNFLNQYFPKLIQAYSALMRSL